MYRPTNQTFPFFFRNFAAKFSNIMTLHIFNPEHDLALAHNQPYFIAPRAGLQLRKDLCFLPALWAAPGDAVLVDNVAKAQQAMRLAGIEADVIWLTRDTLTRHTTDHPTDIIDIRPWGWDLTLRQMLSDCGVNNLQLPTLNTLATIRTMSHRAWAATHLLAQLRTISGTTGEAWEIHHVDEAVKFLATHRNIVLKAPWSSSGRGIRCVFEYEYGDTPQIAPPVANRLRNIVAKQGSIMVEPFYKKTTDFGMEFWSDGKGRIDYLGLSVFSTLNGAYTGNMVDTEDRKTVLLTSHIKPHLLHTVQTAIRRTLAPLFCGTYTGPFGIDMMVVEHDGTYLLHPCVELNLRNTMGHVALALARHPHHRLGTMTIVFDGSYRLEWQPTPE